MPTPEIKVERDSVSFEDDPLAFCRIIYDEALTRQEDLSPINEENRLFYEGKDPLLEARQKDPRVQRSTLFIHELTPAIETRVGQVLARLEERRNPLVATPHNRDATPEQKEQANHIADMIMQQMRDCGYMTDIFEEHITAAEIYRSPAAIKIGWNWESVRKPDMTIIEPPSILGNLASAFRRERVRFKQVKVGRPYVQYLWPEEFLYETHISRFQEDSGHVIHAAWLSYHELLSYATEQNYNLKKIKRLKKDLEETSNRPGYDRSLRDKLAERKQVPIERGYRDGKYLTCENYVITYDDNGDEIVNLVVTVAQQEIIWQGKGPLKGIKYPFVVVTSHRLPGTLEGLSSIDKGKRFQRFYNEIFNAYVDALSYQLFPMFKARKGLVIDGEPKIRPGAVWWMNNLEDFQPLVETKMPLPPVGELLTAISAKIRNLLNAEDLSQGFQAQQYEKATATRYRATGIARRAASTFKRYGMTVVQVADMFLALNQQFHPDRKDFMLEVDFDIPSLTGIGDPDAEKQEAMLLVSQAQQSPIYQNMPGMKKLRNLTEEMIRLFKKTDTDDFVPSDAEYTQVLAKQAEAEIANAAKEAAVQSLAIEQQTREVSNE